jgi:hypothetical protein
MGIAASETRVPPGGAASARMRAISRGGPVRLERIEGMVRGMRAQARVVSAFGSLLSLPL